LMGQASRDLSRAPEHPPNQDPPRTRTCLDPRRSTPDQAVALLQLPALPARHIVPSSARRTAPPHAARRPRWDQNAPMIMTLMITEWDQNPFPARANTHIGTVRLTGHTPLESTRRRQETGSGWYGCESG
jgi:hypothetical protein